MIEVWKKIEGNDCHFVSNLGNVRKNGVLRKQVKDKDGYLFIGININGKRTTRKIHRLVGLAFIPNPMNKPQINHKDGDKTNNVVDNLEWVTNSENQYHKYRKLGFKESLETRMKKRANCGKSNEKKVICIENGMEFESAVKASIYLGVNKNNVSSSINHKYKCKGFTFKYKEVVEDE